MLLIALIGMVGSIYLFVAHRSIHTVCNIHCKLQLKYKNAFGEVHTSKASCIIAPSMFFPLFNQKYLTIIRILFWKNCTSFAVDPNFCVCVSNYDHCNRKWQTERRKQRKTPWRVLGKNSYSHFYGRWHNRIFIFARVLKYISGIIDCNI